MAKFSNSKIGDKVYSISGGWGKIVVIRNDDEYPISVEFENGLQKSYTLDGYYHIYDLYPALFWNEVKLPTDKEDKKPFDLVEYLGDNLTPVEFNNDKFNYFLIYNVRNKKLEFDGSRICIGVNLTYFRENSDKLEDIENTLNYEKVTIKQLKQAYKTLGWI